MRWGRARGAGRGRAVRAGDGSWLAAPRYPSTGHVTGALRTRTKGRKNKKKRRYVIVNL